MFISPLPFLCLFTFSPCLTFIYSCSFDKVAAVEQKREESQTMAREGAADHVITLCFTPDWESAIWLDPFLSRLWIYRQMPKSNAWHHIFQTTHVMLSCHWFTHWIVFHNFPFSVLNIRGIFPVGIYAHWTHMSNLSLGPAWPGFLIECEVRRRIQIERGRI